MHWLTIVALAALIAVSGCSEIEEQQKAAINKAAQRAIEEKIGERVEAKVSESGLTVRRDGTEYTIVLGQGKEVDAKKLPPSLPVFPGSQLKSHIVGINEDTVTLASGGSIEQTEAFYKETLPGQGFTEDNFIKGEGMFSGIWIEPESGRKIFIHVYQQGARPRIVIVITR